MKIINYIKLYNYFREIESLTKSESRRNIWRVRNLPKEFKTVISFILDNQLPKVANFEVDGITLKYLVREEGMKYIQAVFFLDWVRREPDNAYTFMASRLLRNPLSSLEEDDKKSLEDAISRAKQNGKKIKTMHVPEDALKEDIDVEAESEFAGIMTAEELYRKENQKINN